MKKLQFVFLISCISLFASPTLAQGALKSGPNKVRTYYPNGELSTVSLYRKGQLVCYLDYFQNGQLFQRIHFSDGEYHGKYWIWSEEEGRLIKGKMRNGKYFSGEFEMWNNEAIDPAVYLFRRGLKIHKSEID
jgi:hypothetical protein